MGRGDVDHDEPELVRHRVAKRFSSADLFVGGIAVRARPAKTLGRVLELVEIGEQRQRVLAAAVHEGTVVVPS